MFHHQLSSVGLSPIKLTLYCVCQISAPGVPYNVSVAAVNMAGEGEATVLIHFTREFGERLLNLKLRN